MAEVIGLLGGRYSEADKIVEVSICLFTLKKKNKTVMIIYINVNVASEGQLFKYIEVIYCSLEMLEL